MFANDKNAIIKNLKVIIHFFGRQLQNSFFQMSIFAVLWMAYHLLYSIWNWVTKIQLIFKKQAMYNQLQNIILGKIRNTWWWTSVASEHIIGTTSTPTIVNIVVCLSVWQCVVSFTQFTMSHVGCTFNIYEWPQIRRTFIWR